jgi:hypothetical protein
MDFLRSPCRPNSLQHALEWSLCFVTGAPPGSLGRSQGREGHIKWCDVTLIRDVDVKGAFVARIVFNFWKGFNDEQRDPYILLVSIHLIINVGAQ